MNEGIRPPFFEAAELLNTQPRRQLIIVAGFGRSLPLLEPPSKKNTVGNDPSSRLGGITVSIDSSKASDTANLMATRLKSDIIRP